MHRQEFTAGGYEDMPIVREDSAVPLAIGTIITTPEVVIYIDGKPHSLKTGI